MGWHWCHGVVTVPQGDGGGVMGGWHTDHPTITIYKYDKLILYVSFYQTMQTFLKIINFSVYNVDDRLYYETIT